MPSTQQQARLAGALYLLVAVSAPLGLFYVPGQLLDADAALTAQRIRDGEALLHLGMASELFHQAVEVFMVVLLYQLFRPVQVTLARQMAWLGLIPIPIVFVNVLNEVAALTLARGPAFLGAFDGSQLDALACLFLKLHGSGLQIAAIFWGLWLLPLAGLVWRCGFIPKWVAWPVAAAGVGYLLGSVTSLLAPGLSNAVGDVVLVLQLGEPMLILWLVVFGARTVAHSPVVAVAA